MTKVLLSVHVLAAIIFIGPVTVATSLFPRYARQAVGADPGERIAAPSALRLLRRISSGYAVLGLAVPAFGLAVAGRLGVMGDPWLVASIGLTLAASVVLIALVLPAQARVADAIGLDRDDPPGPTGEDASARVLPLARRMSMAAGIFALLWAVVTVLMIIRPGSTLGSR